MYMYMCVYMYRWMHVYSVQYADSFGMDSLYISQIVWHQFQLIGNGYLS